MPSIDAADLSADELDLLITHYLHRQAHIIGPGWEAIDATAAGTRDELGKQIMATAGDLTTLDVWLLLFDSALPCPQHSYDPLPEYVHDAEPLHIKFTMHRHLNGQHGTDIGNCFTPLLTALALYGGVARSLALSTDDPTLRGEGGPDNGTAITWEVENWEAGEVRRQEFTYTGDGDERIPVLQSDTNPGYDTD
ncbi:hypothetical protein AB0I84_22120 [Streptomyces spectabilis]|uniref:hypothetical protein n=1 Tax=Streptomyces spectabilis TaxID=68270 RepID=UPI0033CA7FDF